MSTTSGWSADVIDTAVVPATGLADHLDVGLGVEDQAEAFPDQGVVVG
jgi:hypothetical protein